MSFRVTVTEIKTLEPGRSAVQSVGSSSPENEREIFKQEFPELDLRAFAVALNQKPRGRKPKAAKEAK